MPHFSRPQRSPGPRTLPVIPVPTPVRTEIPLPAPAPRAEVLPALLLCLDLQPIFLAAITDGPPLLQRSSFVVEAARGLGLPVIFTEQVPGKLGGTAPELLALAGTPEAMGKDAFSAFGNEKIAARLQASGVKQLLIAGLETPVCVYQTARDAMKAGYQVTILSDCVGARRPDDAAAVLAQLRHNGCTVLPAETVFYARLQNARHDFFRDYTQLVKKYA